MFSEAKDHEIKWLRSLSVLATEFSTCGKRQYAAVILATNKRVAGFGYNGSPPGMAHCTDGACPRLSAKSEPGSNYDRCIAQHAEAGALLWSDTSLRIGGTIIVNAPPCMGCAKLIASSGLKRVVFKNDPLYLDWENIKEFLDAADIVSVGVDQSTLEKE